MRLLALDPGMATGWSLWAVPEETAMERVNYGLIPGGVAGFVKWARANTGGIMAAHRLVVERFVPGPGPLNYEPLKIEGAIQALLEPHQRITWHLRSDKAHVPDPLLVQHDLWVTGRDPRVQWEDGRDVNDSQIHALAWGKRHHYPTLERFWPE